MDKIEIMVHAERVGAYRFAATVKSPLGMSHVFADSYRTLVRRLRRRVKEVRRLMALQEELTQ